MTASDIARYRLENQKIVGTKFTKPSEVVARLGAIQAQDFAGAKWSIGLRMQTATDGDIEQAISNKTIARSWLMRGTLHFAAVADIRWLQELVAPRMIAGSAGRQRQLELDGAVFTRSMKSFERALRGGGRLTRDEMYAVLENAKISTAGQRGYHILWRAALEGLICFGPQRGRQQTFVLLDEWAPNALRMERDQALAELAKRYFVSRGPATLDDFAYWSGLKTLEARTGLEAIASQLVQTRVSGKTSWMDANTPRTKLNPHSVQLLPGFDEYLLGYRDRTAALNPRYAQRISPGGNGVFRATIVVNGRIAGTWRRTFLRGGVVVAFQPFIAFSETEIRAAARAAGRYGKFLKMPVICNR